MTTLIVPSDGGWSEVLAPTNLTGGALTEEIVIDFSAYNEYRIKMWLVTAKVSGDGNETTTKLYFYNDTTEKLSTGTQTYQIGTSNNGSVFNDTRIEFKFIPATQLSQALFGCYINMSISNLLYTNPSIIQWQANGMQSISINPLSQIGFAKLDDNINNITKIKLETFNNNISAYSKISVYGR